MVEMDTTLGFQSRGRGFDSGHPQRIWRRYLPSVGLALSCEREVMRANECHTPFFTTEDPEIHGCTVARLTGTVT